MNFVCVENNRFFSGRLGPLGAFARRLLVRRLVVLAAREPKTVFLVPEALAADCRKESLRTVSWDDLSLKADFHHETLDEFHRFVTSALRGLCAEMPSELRPESLRLQFLSPLADELPFYLTGFSVLVREKSPARVSFIGGKTVWTSIVTEVARAQGIPCTPERGLLFEPFFFADLAVNSLLRLRQRWSFLLELLSLQPPDQKLLGEIRGGVLYPCPKERSDAFILPVTGELPAAPQILVSAAKITIPAKNPWEHAVSLLSFGPTGLPLVMEYLTAFRSARRAWKKMAKGLAAENHRYRGFSIYHLYAPALHEIWLSIAPVSLLQARRMARLFDLTKPIAAVSFDTLAIGDQMLTEARNRSIPAVLYYGFFNGFESAQLLVEASFPGVADYYFVVNEWMRKRLERMDLGPAAKIVPVGDVRMSLPGREVAHVDEGPIVYCSRHAGVVLLEQERMDWIQRAKDAARKIGRRLCIKPHPHEDRASLSRLCDDNTELTPLGAKNPEVFSKAALVIAPVGSSVAMEAFYLRVPVILYGNEAVTAWADYQNGSTAYRRYGGGLCLTNPEELATAVFSLITDGERRKKLIEGELAYAERMYGPPDGLAPKRFARALEELIRTTS